MTMIASKQAELKFDLYFSTPIPLQNHIIKISTIYGYIKLLHYFKTPYKHFVSFVHSSLKERSKSLTSKCNQSSSGFNKSPVFERFLQSKVLYDSIEIIANNILKIAANYMILYE